MKVYIIILFSSNFFYCFISILKIDCYSLLEHLSYFLSLSVEEYMCHEQFEIDSLPDDNYFIELLNGMEEISVLPLTILVYLLFIIIYYFFIVFYSHFIL